LGGLFPGGLGDWSRFSNSYGFDWRFGHGFHNGFGCLAALGRLSGRQHGVNVNP
jgi:hypothetical protein